MLVFMALLKSGMGKFMSSEFFQAVAMLVLLYGCTTCTLMKRLEKKTRWKLPKDTVSYFEQVLEAPTVCPLTTNPTNRPNNANNICCRQNKDELRMYS